MLAVALLLAVGIGLHNRLPHAPAAAIALAAALFALGLLGRRLAPSCLPIGLAAVLLGVGLAQRAHHRFPADDVARFAADQPRLAHVEVRLDERPRLVRPGDDLALPMPPKQTTLAAVTAVKTVRGWRPASGEMLVQIARPHPELAAGQTVRLLGMLQRPAPAANPGQTDWAAYYRGRRILASLRVGGPGQVELVARDGPPPVARLRQAAADALADGFGPGRDKERALLAAVFLGQRDPEMSDVRDDFRRLGASHHLAVSGMHVAVLAGFVYGLCRLCRAPPRASALIGVGFVLVYGVVTLPTISVLRAVLIASAVGLSIASRRKIDSLQALALAAAALLVVRPMELFEPGFQLSFGTVLGLMLLARPIADRMREWADSAEERDLAGPPDAATLAARWFDGRIVTGLAAAVAAWLVSMPLVARHFEQLNPWAVAASVLLAVPTTLALVAGLLKTALTLALPPLADTSAELAARPAGWMVGSADVLARLPGADVPLPAPAWWLVGAFFLALLAAVVPWPGPGLRWAMRVPLAACGLLILVWPMVARTPLPMLAAGGEAGVIGGGELRVTVLAVGAGQCVAVEPPGGRIVLLDAGSSTMGDPLAGTIGPFLRRRGRTSVDTIVLTHANFDHYGAAADLVTRYGVREVLAPPQFADAARSEAAGRHLLRVLGQEDRPIRPTAAGESFPLARQAAVEVLWPPADFGGDANDTSLVARLTHAGRSVLLTGDIEAPAMRALLADPAARRKLRCDVLIAPHHGSAEPTTAAFVAACDPLLVVSSNDRTLSRKQERLVDAVQNRPLWRTHETGAVTITIGESGELSTRRHLPAGDEMRR